MYFYLNSIFYFYLNYFTFPILWLRISLWNLFTPKILCTPSHSTFVTPNTKIVFFFIISSKNKCWQNLPEIIFGIHQILFQIFGTPWDLLGPKWSKKNTYEVLFIKIGSKGCMDSISEEIFGKYSKINVLGLKFFKKVKFWGLF